MAEAVRPLDDHTPAPRPSLTAVGDAERPLPSVRRWALTGTVIGLVGVVAALIVVVMAQGEDVGPALGVGIPVGLFGGAGFGCMLGSVLALAIREQREG